MLSIQSKADNISWHLGTEFVCRDLQIRHTIDKQGFSVFLEYNLTPRDQSSLKSVVLYYITTI